MSQLTQSQSGKHQTLMKTEDRASINWNSNPGKQSFSNGAN